MCGCMIETDWLVKNLINTHERHLGAEQMKKVVCSVFPR